MESLTPTGSPVNGRRGEGSTHRVLLLADEIFRGRDFARELKTHVADRSDVEVFVISPAIASNRLDQELGNIDPGLPEAGERMVAVIAELNEAGFAASGEIGDADPLVAVGDGLRQFSADEIVVVSHVESEAQPAEKGIWERLRADYHQPVTMLRVGHSSGGTLPEVADIEHAPAHEMTEEDVIRETRNFPPLRRRDLVGILVGLIGTVALGMLAVAVGNQDEGQISGGAAVVLLIAIGAFLLNVAHIVGLLFFESVRYQGIWEKFMARTSIMVTTVGLAIALFVWLT